MTVAEFPTDIVTLVARFDALNDGDLRIGLCTDGTVRAALPTAVIRSDQVTKSLTGYGKTADDAIRQLWRAATFEVEPGESVLVGIGTPDRAEYRWNGGAWKRGDWHALEGGATA